MKYSVVRRPWKRCRLEGGCSSIALQFEQVGFTFNHNTALVAALAKHLGRLRTVHEAQIYERLTQMCRDVFDDDLISLTPELSAKDVDGWDSLTHIRLMLTVERGFKIKFSTSEIGSLKNVGDLVTLIKART